MEPDRTLQLIRLIKVIGFILWVGPLLITARILLLAADEGEQSQAARIALLAKKTALVADIGAFLAICGGLYLLLRNEGVLLKQPFMHIKLTLLVILIGLHGFVRVKVKRATQGRARFPGAALAVLGVVVLAILVVVIFKVPARS